MTPAEPSRDRQERPARDAATPRRLIREVLLVFGAATLICAVLYQLQAVLPWIREVLQGLIAAVFLFLPTEVVVRRRLSFEALGLTHRPVRRGLLAFAAASAVVFPLFGLGFYVYYVKVCGWARGGLALPAQIRAFCSRFVGTLDGVALRLPPAPAHVVLNQLVGVALPEEYFFRGYVQGRLDQALPPRRRLLGATVGHSLWAGATLFALGHVLVDGNPLRLAVFFPGLAFGWLRALTGSILAGVLFHAASNLVIDILQRSFTV